MGKYDDLIGGFKVSIDVEEVLNEEAARKVDDRIKKQKADLEKPIEINVKVNRAENQLKALSKAAKQVKDNLQEALSTKQGADVIVEHIASYNKLKKQIKDITPSVGKNNTVLKESNKILKDTQKIIDQLTVSQDKLNKTRKSKSNTSTKKEAEATKELVGAIEDVAKTQEKTAKTKLRTQAQVNAELDREKQKLKEIEVQQKKNDAARERFQKKRSNYGEVVFGAGKLVYDTDLLKGASKELDEFNELLNTRNKYQEKYNKLCRMVKSHYVSDYGVSQGMYKDLDGFVEANKAMKELDALFESGQKTTNKHINELLNSVVSTLRSELSAAQNMISSGNAVGDMVGQRLGHEEIELNKEMQRLHDERQAQLAKINALRQEELDLIKQAGQAEAKNAKAQNVSVDKAKLDSKVKELKSLISNQEAWIRYLDKSLNKDNFKTSGKREATEQLKTLAQSLEYHRSSNYEHYIGEDAKEMVEVAWMHGYQEAEKQGVAQSTLDRYYDSFAKFDYDGNFAKLQKEYDYRQKVLNESTSELRVIEAQIAAQEQLNNAVERNVEAHEKINSVQKTTEKAKGKSLSVEAVVKRLNELSQDPWNIKSEAEVNDIYKERLSLIEQIGEKKLKAYNADEYEGILNVNEYYRSRLDSFAEQRDDEIYNKLDSQYYYDNEKLESSQELESLLENRIKLMNDIHFKTEDVYKEEEQINQAIKNRIALMKELEPLAAQGLIDRDALESIVFEKGTLDEKRDVLDGIHQNLFNLDEGALDEAQMLLEEYEKILVTTASGKKLELGPEMSEKDYKTFMKSDAEKAKSIEFVRKAQEQLNTSTNEGTTAIEEQTKAAEKLTFARLNAIGEFTQINGELASKHQNSTEFMQKFAELSHGLAQGDIGLEEANKQLKEFMSTLSTAVEKKKLLFETPKNNFQRLANTLATGENAFESKSNKAVLGYSVEDRQAIANAITQGLQAGLQEIKVSFNNGKGSLELFGSIENAARVLNSLGFKAIKSDSSKSVDDVAKKVSDTKKELKFSDGTILNGQQVDAVEKFCARLKKSMGEAYNEARTLQSALELVFDISNGNVEKLMGRFHNGNPASNEVLKMLTGMDVNNQKNRDAALRSINPEVYDKIIADTAEAAKAEMENQKSEFQNKWNEFVSAMLGGDAFEGESKLAKGKILKAFSEYGKTATEAIHTINKAWLAGDLEGKSGKTKYIQSYIDFLDNQKEHFDELRKSKAGDLDVDSLFELGGTTGISEEKAQVLRDQAAAWDELIAKKKEYYGIVDVKSSQLPQENKLLDEQVGKEQNILAIETKTSSAIEANIQTKQEQIKVEDEITKKIEQQAEAEKQVAEAANKTANALKNANNVSAEELIARDMEEALAQLRSAKNNETTLFNLKGVLEGDDLVDQAQAMVKNIAEQANLSLGKFNVKDDIVKVQLYNKELQVTVDQLYRLKAATEETGTAQLELMSQSFSQNVKALNENNFDVEGVQQRALASIEKVRSSLHGLEYDLTDLENAAKNISSQDDFTKFNNQLKAAQDNIQAIKNSTVSKSSMNPLANMQRDMQNSNIEIETMRLKLEKFGDIQGVAEAKQMLTEMTEAVKEYHNATDAQGQQNAYNQYSNVRSSFKAQTEYIKAAQDLNKSQATSAKQEDPIREQYKSILDLVNKINDVSANITKYQTKDSGSGIFAGYIGQLQSEKSKLVSELKNITDEINNTLSSGFVQGKEFSVPFASFLDGSGAISNFLNDTKTQASLTTEEIEKLVVALQKSQNIDVQAATKVAEQFKSVQETYTRLSDLTSIDKSNANYQALGSIFTQIMQYKEQLSSDSTSWTPEESAHLQSLIDQFTKYGNALADVGEKEARYFAGKAKYTQGTTFGSAIQNVSEDTEKLNNVRKQLEDAAKSFAKDSGSGDAFITGFTQSADGISRLDFSVFDTATGSLRNFKMEMGSVTEGMYVTETTISKSLANIQAAHKQLQSVGSLLGRLDVSGVNLGEGSAPAQVQKLLDLYKQLSAEISKGDGADQNKIAKLTKDLKLASSETEKFYKQMLQMEGAIASGKVKNLGVGNLSGDIYGQLTAEAQKLASAIPGTTVALGGFNAETNTLNATLTHASGAVESIQLQMNGLNGQMTAQRVGVSKLTSTWGLFKTTVMQAGKRLVTALVGYNVFYKAISQVRKGIGYIKEIDLALTELKKVTDETEASYRKFLDTAAGTAGQIGSTLSEFTEATANFARLGYTMKESADMAKTALVYKNVADGLDTVDEATESIISTMKAFGIESNGTMGIIDRFNEVGVILPTLKWLKTGNIKRLTIPWVRLDKL